MFSNPSVDLGRAKLVMSKVLCSSASVVRRPGSDVKEEPEDEVVDMEDVTRGSKSSSLEFSPSLKRLAG